MDEVRTGGVRLWRGPQDLLRLQAELRCSSPDPRRFQAEERVITADGIVLRDWRSTELSGTEAPELPEPAVQLAVVLTGQVRWATTRQRWVGAPGSVHLLHGDDRTLWTIAHGTRLVHILLPVGQLPAHLRPLTTVPSGPLPESRMAAAFVGTLQQSVGAAAETPGAATYLVRGLQNMALALLEELPSLGDDGDLDLRNRILAHIEHHLHEPDLNPRSIASTFSVSLRWVHQAFNTADTSLARYIRHRRVDAVAEVLRGERRSPRTGALAIRFGFSGREQLARCFRARYGVTVTAYHGLVVDGLPLPGPQREADGAEEDRVA